MGIDRDFDNLSEPQVISSKLLSMRVCVPAKWTDKQVVSFAESQNPSGVSTGWQVRKEGDVLLCGNPERNPCDNRSGFVHIVLDC